MVNFENQNLEIWIQITVGKIEEVNFKFVLYRVSYHYIDTLHDSNVIHTEQIRSYFFTKVVLIQFPNLWFSETHQVQPLIFKIHSSLTFCFPKPFNSKYWTLELSKTYRDDFLNFWDSYKSIEMLQTRMLLHEFFKETAISSNNFFSFVA